MVTFSRTNMLFFTSLFFLTMLPMDPPQKKQSFIKKTKNRILHKNKKRSLVPSQDQNHTKADFISWGNQDEKREQLGGVFANYPKEIIYPYFLIKCDPATKNILRKTNKTFSILLSWEKKQPFMLRKELCIGQNDIKSIIIQSLYPHSNVSNNPMPSDKQIFVAAMGKKLENFSYPIAGSIDNKIERLELELALSNLSKPLLFISDHKGSPVGSTDISAIICPLIIACIARNPDEVENCLQKMSLNSLYYEDFQRALHILIKNNDEQSLQILLNEKKRPSIHFDLSSKLQQLVFFHASLNVMSIINNIHRRNILLAQKSGIAPKEKDFIGLWLGLTDGEGKHYNLYSIIETYHKMLLEKHTNENSIAEYYACLNNSFKKKGLIQLGLPVEIINNSKKTDKKESKEKERK